MKVLIFKEKKTEKELYGFQMGDIMKGIFLIICITAMENLNSLTNFMKVTEFLIKWKGNFLSFRKLHRYGRLI